MHNKTLRTFTWTLGLGLLAGCPADPSTTTEGSSGTDTSTTDVDPSNPANPTNTTPPTSDTDPTPTTEGPGTDPTDSTDTDPTVTDPSATDTNDTDTTDGGVDAELCVHLGGQEGVKELVTTFVGNVLLDEKINGYFLNSDVDGGALIDSVSDQLGEVAGCAGVTYGGASMLEAHAGMGISDQDFNDFAVDFSAALDTHSMAHPDITDEERAAILDTLGGMKPDIVEDPDNNLTVYQRVGRKPAIKGLVGHPEEVDSFVGKVAADDSINSFFAMSDFVRLNTCLTRQVADIDGPIKYGLEVDSPGPGIDEGVSKDDPCKDMVTVHQDLLDADMTAITVEDFIALVTDLVDAMTVAMVPQDDQNAILGALGPLCDQIVVGNVEKNKCPGNGKVELVEAPDLALPLNDDGYDGSIESMVCADLVITDEADYTFVGDVEVVLGLDHPYVGDTTLKVQSPAGTVLTIYQRPGNGVLPDNGASCCGDSANLSKDAKVTFKNGSANDAGKMGVNLPPAAAVICKDDGICDFKPNHGSGPGVDFGDFTSEAPAGTWKVCVGDSQLNDLGTLDFVSLAVTKVKYDPKL